MDTESTIAAWKNPEVRSEYPSQGTHPAGLAEIDPVTAEGIGGGTGWVCAATGAIAATFQGTVCNGTCAVPSTQGCCNG